MHPIRATRHFFRDGPRSLLRIQVVPNYPNPDRVQVLITLAAFFVCLAPAVALVLLLLPKGWERLAVFGVTCAVVIWPISWITRFANRRRRRVLEPARPAFLPVSTGLLYVIALIAYLAGDVIRGDVGPLCTAVGVVAVIPASVRLRRFRQDAALSAR